MQVSREGLVTVISLGKSAKQFDEPLTEALSAELVEAVQQAKPPYVLLDFQGVSFFGSSFIETLFRVWKRVQNEPDGRFALCSLEPYCREVLEVTRLNQVWQLYSSRNEGVAGLSQAPASGTNG